MRERAFPFSQDQVDALRFEYQTIPPKAEAIYGRHVAKVVSFLQEAYKSHIPPEYIERQKGIGERVVVTDRESYNQLTSNHNTKGYADDNGYIVMKEPATYWEDLDVSIKRQLVRDYGDKRMAKVQSMYSIFYSALTHETVHMFQQPGLPEWFIEMGTSYYTRQYLLHDRLPILFHEDINEERIRAYQELVNRYGNTVHDVFFGTRAIPGVISKMLNLVPEMKITQLLGVQGRRS